MERVLKRYRNRKLYDQGAGTYVSLPGVAALVRAGDQVTVLDHVTGRDLTGYILASVVAKEELEKPKPEVAEQLRAILVGKNTNPTSV